MPWDANPPGDLPAAVAEMADLGSILVDGDFSKRLADCQGKLRTSYLSTGPEAALAAATALVENSTGDEPVIHVISDFRAIDWGSPDELLLSMQSLAKEKARIQLVRCVDESHANLAITDLRPAPGNRAAGIPIMMEVTVANYGPQLAQNITITPRQVSFPPPDESALPGSLTSNQQVLPSLLMERLEPGKTATMQFQAFFPVAGNQIVAADLPVDAVLADNTRSCVLDLPPGNPVLVIDGDPQQANQRYLATVFQPSERVQTGVRPVTHPVSYLRDVSPEELDPYFAIYLLDVPGLDDRSQANLERYLRGGGGVAIFLGPNSDLPFYRAWCAGGEGIFPLVTERLESLGPTLQPTPDIQVEDVPLARFLWGDQNPFLDKVRVRDYVRTSLPATTTENDSASTTILARLRSGKPLLVERTIGEGRLLVATTSLSPVWNTFYSQPTFVTFLLNLQSHLASRRAVSESYLVGGNISKFWNEGTNSINPELAVVPLDMKLEIAESSPTNSEQPTSTAARVFNLTGSRSNSGPDPGQLEFRLSDLRDTGATRITDRPGVLELWVRNSDGTPDIERLPLNVLPTEGDLSLAEPAALTDKLATTGAEWVTPNDIQMSFSSSEGGGGSRVWLVIIGIMLLAEQLLGYINSYHPSARGMAR
jgi:hypothetical protein